MSTSPRNGPTCSSSCVCPHTFRLNFGKICNYTSALPSSPGCYSEGAQTAWLPDGEGGLLPCTEAPREPRALLRAAPFSPRSPFSHLVGCPSVPPTPSLGWWGGQVCPAPAGLWGARSAPAQPMALWPQRPLPTSASSEERVIQLKHQPFATGLGTR